jgi:type II secretory pathway pseudopilin PulG
MKALHSRIGERRGLTLLEAVIVVAILLVVAGVLLPLLAPFKAKASRVACTNNLKQIGLSFRIFATDHSDAFPMQVSTNQEGSSEFRNSSEVFRHFLVLSNELGTPKILVCPQDLRTNAPNFDNLANSNISYFVGLDGNETRPDVVLSGDSNLTTNEIPVRSGIFPITSQTRIGFTRERHITHGNICMSDGSVQVVSSSNLWQVFQSTNSFTNWLAVP